MRKLLVLTVVLPLLAVCTPLGTMAAYYCMGMKFHALAAI